MSRVQVALTTLKSYIIMSSLYDIANLLDIVPHYALPTNVYLRYIEESFRN